MKIQSLGLLLLASPGAFATNLTIPSTAIRGNFVGACASKQADNEDLIAKLISANSVLSGKISTQSAVLNGNSCVTTVTLNSDQFKLNLHNERTGDQTLLNQALSQSEVAYDEIDGVQGTIVWASIDPITPTQVHSVVPTVQHAASVLPASSSALQGMAEADYVCRGIQSSDSFPIQQNGTLLVKNGKAYSFNASRSKSAHQVIYLSSDNEAIAVDGNIAALSSDGTSASLGGMDGYIRLSSGNQYLCSYSLINFFPTGAMPDSLATSNGSVNITLHLPAQISTVMVSVVKESKTSETAVNVPHDLVAVTPGKLVSIPLLDGSGTYLITLSDQDQNVDYAAIRVTNSDTEILKYVEPSQAVLSDDPEIVSLAKSITQGMTTDREKIIAVHDWIASHITYDFTASGNANINDDLINSVLVLHAKKAICFGYSTLNAGLLRALGIPTKFMLGITLNHAWNEVLLDGTWYLDDTTWDAFAYYAAPKGKWVYTGVLDPSRQYGNLGFMPGASTTHPLGADTNL